MSAVRHNALTRAIWRIHRGVFRMTGGRLGSRVAGHDVLFLTTTGRKSGEARTVGLYFLVIPVSSLGGNLRRPGADIAYAVIGSYAGEDRDPAWAHNLRADPAATIQIGREEHPVVARETEGAERAGLLGRFVEKDDAYRVYQERTDRRIPIFVLEAHR